MAAYDRNVFWLIYQMFLKIFPHYVIEGKIWIQVVFIRMSVVIYLSLPYKLLR